jgi:acetyl-CoA carboxylase carboxyltransferase component
MMQARPANMLLYFEQKGLAQEADALWFCMLLLRPAGMNDAIRTGTGLLHGIPVALAVMEFGFMGGSMGSVVGEKLTRLIEYATQEGLTLLVVCTSGGARMQVRCWGRGDGACTAALQQMQLACVGAFSVPCHLKLGLVPCHQSKYCKRSFRKCMQVICGR